ncbi:hypothetical protein Plhal703r1_c15g0073221 [Plasmopara halstedii]
MGFYLRSTDHRWQKVILPAFQTYYQVYRNCNVKRDFVVPEKEPWPLSVRGINLGMIAQNIRYRGDYFLQWQYVVLPALNTYVHLFGNAHVPTDFVVPSNNQWPERSHGFKLGLLSHAQRGEKDLPTISKLTDCTWKNLDSFGRLLL